MILSFRVCLRVGFWRTFEGRAKSIFEIFGPQLQNPTRKHTLNLFDCIRYNVLIMMILR
jgi:hypothetical protein